ncbi:MAG: hypothetical protein GF416_09060 [Candidatus Altiarchaeales archaeon]|nr:hypothetical protein [Candidatus Altiarchaeales archaeon]MBD3417267.1 hypothetical protein [Candidatus Altiarchaeales archaeon]
MKEKITLTVLVAAVFMVLAGTASAVTIGAGPSTIDFGKMVKGGYAERVITVSTSGDEDLTCTIELTGDIADWMSTDQGDVFELPADSRQKVLAMVEPPEDSENGRYSGAIYIKAAPTSELSGGTGLIVGAGVKIKVGLEITDEETVSYKLSGASVSDTEIGYPIKFTANVMNNGNVEAKPQIDIRIMDQAGAEVKTHTQAGSDILPTVTEDVVVEVPSDDLQEGFYRAKVMVGDEEQEVKFNILQPGTLAVKGVLKSLSVNKMWVEAGESVKIAAEVENTGKVLIENAKLTAEVYMIDDRYETENLVKPVEGAETLDVPVGQTVELVAYFTPPKAGRYKIYGAVSYEDKKTKPKSTILNVLQAPKDYTLYIVGAVVVVLVALFWLTRRGEDGRTRRFKRIWGDYLQIK